MWTQIDPYSEYGPKKLMNTDPDPTLFSTLRHVLAFCFLVPVYQPEYSAVSDSSMLNIINLTYQGQKNISGRVICQHEQDESSKQFHIDHPSFTLSKR